MRTQPTHRNYLFLIHRMGSNSAHPQTMYEVGGSGEHLNARSKSVVEFHKTPTPFTHSVRTSEVPGVRTDKDLFIEVCSSDYCHKVDKLVKELKFKTFSLPGNSRSNTFSNMEKVDFCMDVIYPLSSKLIDGSLYYDQTLVVIVYESSISFKNVTESKLDPTLIKCILFFERSNNFQAYRLANLSNCPHFTLETLDLPTFVSNLNDLLRTPIDVIFVAKTVPIMKMILYLLLLSTLPLTW